MRCAPSFFSVPACGRKTRRPEDIRPARKGALSRILYPRRNRRQPAPSEEFPAPRFPVRAAAATVWKNGICTIKQALPPRRKPFLPGRTVRTVFQWKIPATFCRSARKRPQRKAERHICRSPVRLRRLYIRQVFRPSTLVFFPRYYCMPNAANYLTYIYFSAII